jgi:hypothetical protein
VPGRLRTFCHISEYDEAGYRQLGRLIAASDPLVLWAPSSEFLSDPSCPISSREFLEFVEEGAIQVVAREEWLDSPEKRNEHPWPKARWNAYVDEALQYMCRRDDSIPDLRERRVVSVGDETGKSWAEQAIEERPEVAAEIAEALGDATREGEIPPGTLQTAARATSGRTKKVEVVLRDAYNHSDAIRQSEAETAILLGPGDGVFARQVAAIHTDAITADEGQRDQADRSEAEAVLAASELSRQLVDLLAVLEELGPGTDLRSFLDGPGHRELVKWSRGVIEMLRGIRPDDLKERLGMALKRDLVEGGSAPTPLALRAIGPPSAALSAASFVSDHTPLALLGLAFAAFPYLYAGAQDRDLADTNFSGPQWPFRYLWDGGARHGRLAMLLDALEAPPRPSR